MTLVSSRLSKWMLLSDDRSSVQHMRHELDSDKHNANALAVDNEPGIYH
jgi:hypothetical protein